MSDNYHFVAAVDEFGGELIDVAFDAAGLGEEEIADHGDVVGHFGYLWDMSSGGSKRCSRHEWHVFYVLENNLLEKAGRGST